MYPVQIENITLGTCTVIKFNTDSHKQKLLLQTHNAGVLLPGHITLQVLNWNDTAKYWQILIQTLYCSILINFKTQIILLLLLAEQ
jgi:uncharacterized protein YunC (DUF1805 family)